MTKKSVAGVLFLDQLYTCCGVVNFHSFLNEYKDKYLSESDKSDALLLILYHNDITLFYYQFKIDYFI